MTIYEFALPDELETIKKHIEQSKELSANDIILFWRDNANILCVKYISGKWWHYSKDGEWW